MKEKFRITQESANCLNAFEEVAREIVTKCNKKPPHNNSITLLCALLFFAL
ncbi:TPA: hypothetical protein MB355_004747 [Klebsiella quasipneumoniae subsp. similipneumoniae]